MRVKGEMVSLRLTDGTWLRLPTFDQQLAAQLGANIGLAMSKFTGDDRANPDASPLQRHGRSPGQWRRELLKLPVGHTNYRDNRLSADQVLAILQDPAQPPEYRVGAAMVLRGTTEPRYRIAIEQAAQACANGPLRIALMSADQEQLEETALAEAESLYLHGSHS